MMSSMFQQFSMMVMLSKFHLRQTQMIQFQWMRDLVPSMVRLGAGQKRMDRQRVAQLAMLHLVKERNTVHLVEIGILIG